MKGRSVKRFGFTRVEVVAMVAITVLLSTALLPAFAQWGLFGVFTRARENARRTSCQSNLKQVALAVMQYVHDNDERYPTVSAGSGTKRYGWADSIQPYIKNLQVFQCPSEKHKAGTDAKRPGYTDYWYNRNLSRVSIRQIKFISNTLLAGDGDGGAAQSNARYTLNTLPGGWVSTPYSPAQRHLDGANYAYTDGHVKWLRPERVTTAKPSRTVTTFRAK